MIALELPRHILLLILFAECYLAIKNEKKTIKKQLHKQLNRCRNDSEKVYQSVADKCIAPSKNNSNNNLLDSNFEKTSNNRSMMEISTATYYHYANVGFKRRFLLHYY